MTDGRRERREGREEAGRGRSRRERRRKRWGGEERRREKRGEGHEAAKWIGCPDNRLYVYYLTFSRFSPSPTILFIYISRKICVSTTTYGYLFRILEQQAILSFCRLDPPLSLFSLPFSRSRSHLFAFLAMAVASHSHISRQESARPLSKCLVWSCMTSWINSSSRCRYD